MNLGYNLVWLGERAGGVGRYAVELLRALTRLPDAPAIVALVARDTPASATPPEVERLELPVRAGRRAALVAQLIAVPAIASRRSLDVVHTPVAGPPAIVPGAATVVTVQDLIWLHQGDAWEGRAAQRSARLVQVHSGRRARRVLVSSRAVRDDVVATMGLDPACIDVVPFGVGADETLRGTSAGQLRTRLRLGEGPVVLCVAQKRPYKNLSALIRAMVELGDEAAQLVLPGAPTPHEDDLRALAERLGVTDRVRFPDWLSEEDLEGLYGLAACFCLPSIMEGFGLPVLEAMRRGLPVACSDRWALPEVAGDAALLFDPTDQAAITGALRRLLNDRALARDLAARGRARAAEFTWRRTAQGTLDTYRRTLG